jgi:hypothetical protein
VVERSCFLEQVDGVGRKALGDTKAVFLCVVQSVKAVVQKKKKVDASLRYKRG